MDYAFWLKLHKRLFGDVWRWAGKVRTHELQNEEFSHPGQIWSDLRQLEGDVRFWIENNTYPITEIAARFHERIETIHPFPNGNGRAGRILVEHFCARHATPPPTWLPQLANQPNLRRRAYIEALRKARCAKDYGDLIAAMFDCSV